MNIEDEDNVEEIEPSKCCQPKSYRRVRRCSSTGDLDSLIDKQKGTSIQHPAITRLKFNQNRSEGNIHRKLERQIAFPFPFCPTSSRNECKYTGCLKSPTLARKEFSYSEEETRSTASVNRVRIGVSHQLSINSDVSDEVFLDMEEEPISKTCYKNRYGCLSYRGRLRNRFMVILSGLYGILLVVFGLVIPLAETLIYPLYVFEVFYMYLFVVSMVFLLYVYIFLLHGGNEGLSKLASQISIRSLRKTKGDNSRNNLRSLDNISNCSRFRKRRITFDQTSNHHTGSFYLRLGAVGFGMGSMILDGLYFGQYFDHAWKMPHCDDIMEAIKPAFKFMFTFTQLYFIFQNSKMRILKYPSIARFGLMHMCATNICVWFRVIVVETLNSIHESKHLHEKSFSDDGVMYHSDHLKEHNHSYHHQEVTTHAPKHDFAKLPEISCQWSDYIGKILMAATPYLYPFCIEYSLICAAILYVMWENVGKRHNKSESDYVDEFDDGYRKRSHQMSVDCAGSSRGLFLGILFFVFGVISTIAFHVVIGTNDKAGYLIANLSETFIYLFAIFSIVIASVRMRSLKFLSLLKDRLEENLILVSLTGLYMFGVFNLIAGSFYVDRVEGVLTLVSNVTMMVEATMQTIFMFAALRMSACHPVHARKKPGREFVTFLLLCNFAMWGITTFETRSIAHNSLQLKFYGANAWAIFEHISVPLGIFYRFHSTVCLSHVWKNAWKRKKRLREKI